MPKDNPILKTAREKAKARELEAATLAEQSIAANQEELKAATEQVRSNNREINSLNDIVASSIQETAAADRVITKQKEVAELKAQNDTIEAIKPFTNVQNQRNLLSQLEEENKRLDSLQNEKTSIMTRDTGMPLLFDLIYNAVSAIPTDIAIQSAESERDQTRRHISDMAAASESINQINIKNKKIRTEATVQAELERIDAITKGQVALAKQKGIASNSAHVNQLMNMSSKQADNQVKLWQIRSKQYDDAVQKEKTELDIKQQKLLIQTYESNLKKAEFREKTIQNIEDAANSGRRLRGLKPFPKGVAVQLFEAGTPEQRQQIEKLIFLGTAEYSDETGTPPIADNPYDAKETIHLIDPSGAGEETKATATLSAIEEKAEKEITKLSAGGRLSDEQVKAEFNRVAKEYQDEKEANIATGDVGNPYHAPDFETIGEMVKGRNKLYDEVLAEAQMKETNPQTIYEMTTAAIMENKITPAEAVKNIKSLFDAAVNYNNGADGGFERYGLRPQRSYITTVQRPKGNVDMFLTEKSTLIPDVTPLSGLKKVLNVSDTVLKNIVQRIDPYKIRTNLIDETSVRDTLNKFLSVQRGIKEASEPPKY